jgi:phenol hydroxylase P4 protein
MAVKALYENYSGPNADALENFHGNQVVYIGWDEHMMFPFAGAFPLPPQMPFAALVKDLLPLVYGAHPDFARIDWAAIEWSLDGARFTPDMDKSIGENGVAHKSLLRLATPGLNGIGNAGF